MYFCELESSSIRYDILQRIKPPVYGHTLPGQAVISHSSIFVASPIQACPSEDGVGLVHVRCLCDRPGPHVLLQDDQPDHVLHPPLTRYHKKKH